MSGEGRSASPFPTGSTEESTAPLPDVLAITDPVFSDDELAERANVVLRAVPRASVALQIRDKIRPARAVLALGERLARICAEFGAPIYVNDRLDVALAVCADGVHLGGASIEPADARRVLGSQKFVSVVAHGEYDVERAAASGATAALVSPIFASPGKRAPFGTSLVTQARARAPRLRLYALGGVDSTNAASCVAAGADGVAVIRAVWQAADPGAAANALVQAVRSVAPLRRG
jgi:thiamine-phosphate pyrophosphorylase